MVSMAECDLKPAYFGVVTTLFRLSYVESANNKINKLFDCAPKWTAKKIVNEELKYECVEKSKDGEKEFNVEWKSAELSRHLFLMEKKKKIQNVRILLFSSLHFDKVWLVFAGCFFFPLLDFYIDVGSGGIR